MRRYALFAALVVVSACSDLSPDPLGPEVAPASLARVSGPQQIPVFQPGVVVARFQAAAPAAAIAAAHGASVARDMRAGIRVLAVPDGTERTVVDALSRDPRVMFAELSVPRTLGIPCAAPDGNCEVPSDEHFGRRWDLHNDGAVRDAAGNVLATQGFTPDADMDWLEAFDYLGAFTGGALLGIVDTGIFGSHEDLSGRLQAQHDFFNIDPIAEDDHGHGTHASGIMVAHGNNAKGGAGVAYGPNIRLAVAKGCGNTIIGYICWSPDIADGIMWLADQGVAAINLSLGGQSPSSVEQFALQYAVASGVLPVCAAGNDSGAVDWPAAFPECMAVSATGPTDALTGYSSFGPEVEVSAPGGEILHPNALDGILSTWLTGGYAYLSGTSMAAPQVTGLAGLLHALGVTSAADKRAIIRATADDLGAAGPDPQYGSGRINVWAAVQQALGNPPPPPPPPTNEPPVASFTYDCTDLTCSFQDTSTDDVGVVSWSWNFGDGATSPQQSPTHEYAAGGTYTVSLVVTDGGQLADTTSQQVTVTEPPPPPPNQPPIASFTYSCTGLTCDFTDTSTDDVGIVARLWDFGDGAWSTEANPRHTYANAGTYTVALLVEDAENELGLATEDVTVVELPPVLSVAALKVKGELVPELTWTGTVKPVDLYRDGARIASAVSSAPPVYRDFTGRRGKATLTYVACLAGTTNCSAPVTVVY